MSKLLQFIKEHKDWRELLKAPPYNLFVKEKDNYTLFMYNVYDSDLSDPIVQEARGLIIDHDNLMVVCRAFDKFFNYGEPNAAEIDWESAEVQEKVDGSIIKVWWDKDWHISTQSTIDARDAIFSDDQYGNFFWQFIAAFERYLGMDLVPCSGSIKWKFFDKYLSKEYTHIFELVSPKTKVVVDYPENRVYYIGCRETATGKEIPVPKLDESLPVYYPKKYPLKTLEGCLNAAQYMNANDTVEEEGFVVVDKYFHRIKIKSPKYIEMHHMATINPSDYRLLEIILNGEMQEVLVYFPKLKERFEPINNTVLEIVRELGETIRSLKNNKELVSDRKAMVDYIKANYEHRYFDPIIRGVYNDSDPYTWFEFMSKDNRKEYVLRDYRRVISC